MGATAIHTQKYLVKCKNGCVVCVWSRVSMRGMQGLLYNNKQRGREKQRLIVKLLPQESFQESSFCSSKANYCPRPKQWGLFSVRGSNPHT